MPRIRPYKSVSRIPPDYAISTINPEEPPAEHWVHLRTTNPIESTFATIRHRTARTKGCVSRGTMLAMIFKLGTCAQRKWRRLRGFDKVAKVIRDVRFVDGIEQTEKADQTRNAA